MPLFTVALINPHGRITGVGKATLQMKAATREHARYDALAYCRENYNWAYHFKDGTPPADKEYAGRELDMLRDGLGLSKKEHKLADLPAAERSPV